LITRLERITLWIPALLCFGPATDTVSFPPSRLHLHLRIAFYKAFPAYACGLKRHALTPSQRQ